MYVAYRAVMYLVLVLGTKIETDMFDERFNTSTSVRHSVRVLARGEEMSKWFAKKFNCLR